MRVTARVGEPLAPDDGWLRPLYPCRAFVGEAVVSLRFFRKGPDETDFEVLERRGRLHVVRQPSLWSLTTGAPRRVREALSSLAKG